MLIRETKGIRKVRASLQSAGVLDDWENSPAARPKACVVTALNSDEAS